MKSNWPLHIEEAWRAFEAKHGIDELTEEKFDSLMEESGAVARSKMIELFGPEPKDGFTAKQETMAIAALKELNQWPEIFNDIVQLPLPLQLAL
jgi:hypothetical protein